MTCRFSGVFDAENGDDDSRYVTTGSLNVGPSAVIEFQLATNCRRSTSEDVDEPPPPPVRLEYSTDHGMTWALVLPGCWPPAPCTHYHPPSVYQLDQFPRWTRITVILPPYTWCVLQRPPPILHSRTPKL